LSVRAGVYDHVMDDGPEDLNAMPVAALFSHLCERPPGDAFVRRLLELARDEDVGAGDVTSIAALDERREAEGIVRAREGGVAAGLALVPAVLGVLAPGARVVRSLEDGSEIRAGLELCAIRGPARQVLTAERTVLNLLGRLCGVATRTRGFVDAIGPDRRARVYDTRKTTPGMRHLEKFAVRCGGGMCHRLGLHDAMLLKDNHLALGRGGTLGERVEAAARRARELARERSGLRFVEVEVDTLAQLEEVLGLEAGLVDVLLLDNMRPDELADAVRRRDQTNRAIRLEASGGVSLETVGEIAATGVERISTGSLTHHAVWLDIGLDVESPRGDDP